MTPDGFILVKSFNSFKSGKRFDCYGGLVSGVEGIPFTNTEYFKPYFKKTNKKTPCREINNQFVTYEIATKVKEMGFNKKCIAFYNGDFLDFKIDNSGGTEPHQINVNKDIGLCIDAPLWQQVTDWFRDKHRIEIEVTRDFNGYRYMIFNSGDLCSCISDIGIKSFENAREQAILKAIELIK